MDEEITGKRYKFSKPVTFTDDFTAWYDIAADEMVIDNGIEVQRAKPQPEQEQL